MIATGFGCSDAGLVRERNEDCYFVDDDLGLYIVSDGMGGHAAGDVASTTAVSAVVRYMRARWGLLDKARRFGTDVNDIRVLLEQAVQSASYQVFELAARTPPWRGMGATFTAVLVVRNTAVVAHVGDSRLYLLRHGVIRQVTTDHTVAGHLLRAGAIQPEDVKTSLYAHMLSRNVGMLDAVPVDTMLVDLLDGDRFLLCSDGLTEYLSDEVLASKLDDGDSSDVASQLVAIANASGGGDNVTAVVVDVQANGQDYRSDSSRGEGRGGRTFFSDLQDQIQAMLTRGWRGLGWGL